MSDTYNENEFLKLKHLNEFARQLNIKLDGGTDPKLPRVFSKIRVWSGSNAESYTTGLDGDIIEVNFPFSRFVSARQIAPNIFSDSFTESCPMPIITGDFPCKQFTWNPPTASASYVNSWMFNFTVDEQIAQVCQWEITFPESENYQERKFTFKINITEG